MTVNLRNFENRPPQLKVGNHFSEEKFIPAEKFNEEKESLQVPIKKADSLWVKTTNKHVYSFDLRDKQYNTFLVQPAPKDSKPWINRPIYVNKNKEIRALFSRKKKKTLKKIPQKTLIAPVSGPPSYPELNGKQYFPIARHRIFKL